MRTSLIERWSIVVLLIVMLGVEIEAGKNGPSTDLADFKFPESCDRSSFSGIPKEYQCDCAQATADDNDAIFDYVVFNYCTFQRSSWLAVIIMTCWLVYLFYIIATTTDNYMVPVVTRIVNLLQMPPNLAGATLLAFSNGAPDLFSSIASFSGKSEIGDLGLGNLLGGGLFVSIFTLGYIALRTKGGFEVRRWDFLRDVVMYFVSIVLYLIYYTRNKINLWQAILFLVLYFVYGIMLVFGSTIYRKLKMQICMSSKGESTALTNSTGSNESNESNVFQIPCTQLGNTLPLTESQPGTTAATRYGILRTPTFNNNCDTNINSVAVEVDGKFLQKIDNIQLQDDKNPYLHDDQFQSIQDVEALISPNVFRRLSNSSFLSSYHEANAIEGGAIEKVSLLRTFFEQCKVELFMDDDSDPTWYNRVITWLEMPLTVARILTIPHVNPETWHPFFLLGNAFCTPFFVFLVIFRSQAAKWVNLLVTSFVAVTLVLLLIFAFKVISTNQTFPESTRIQVVLCFLAFALSTVWAYLLASEIVAVMQAIGLGIGISSGALGVTVLAWGNSIGDFVSDTAVARSGHTQMAATACIAGPIFNVLFGGGISLVLGCVAGADHVVFLPVSDAVGRYGFLFLLSGLVLMVAYTLLNRFVLDWKIGGFNILLYVMFLVFAILAESKVIERFF